MSSGEADCDPQTIAKEGYLMNLKDQTMSIIK